ncbi:uncharacterized protein RSE6_13552 [Rhynchosporium secalis]|uniref:Uncharacterized protein n=1 Tax=Rhynchosporium secalis TaxID=38038 RepID=A0A1E1MT53_RHYSE|nr:uncharacterized protein RSE6_13552 [Rhynchosporium secalis]
MCSFYMSSCAGYTYLMFRFKLGRTRRLFQAGSASSILMAITNGILLVVNLVRPSPKDLGLWILCVVSSVCTLRFALWEWGKKALHTITAQLVSPTGPSIQAGSRRDSGWDMRCEGGSELDLNSLQAHQDTNC